MKTRPVAVRLPLALITSLERQAEREARTVADVIRHVLAASQSNQKDQILEKLLMIESQVKLLSQGQNQLTQKLSEFDIDVGEH